MEDIQVLLRGIVRSTRQKFNVNMIDQSMFSGVRTQTELTFSKSELTIFLVKNRKHVASVEHVGNMMYFTMEEHMGEDIKKFVYYDVMI